MHIEQNFKKTRIFGGSTARLDKEVKVIALLLPGCF